MGFNMKKCFKCGITQSLADFYRHPRMADGHLNKCKTCTKADSRINRSENLERFQEYDRSRSSLPHRVEARAKYQKTEAGMAAFSRARQRYKERYPDRRAAHIALGNAVRDGLIVPWPVCALPECNEKPEAHHADYSLPLGVVWLCPAHHRQAHALFSKLIAESPAR